MSVTRFLASVRDEGEAALALAAGADIIDLKDPDNGALGAVAPPTMKACLTRIAGRAPVSATVGDLPMEPGVIARAVALLGVSGGEVAIFEEESQELVVVASDSIGKESTGRRCARRLICWCRANDLWLSFLKERSVRPTIG